MLPVIQMANFALFTNLIMLMTFKNILQIAGDYTQPDNSLHTMNCQTVNQVLLNGIIIDGYLMVTISIVS